MVLCSLKQLRCNFKWNELFNMEQPTLSRNWMYICFRTNQLTCMKWIFQQGMRWTNYEISCPQTGRGGGGGYRKGGLITKVLENWLFCHFLRRLKYCIRHFSQLTPKWFSSKTNDSMAKSMIICLEYWWKHLICFCLGIREDRINRRKSISFSDAERKRG